MNISDEAVEAAAEAMHDRDAYAELFEDAPEHRRARYLDAARGILEAAAPHLMAAVSTVAELDALPRFSVIRSEEGAVFERQTMWHEAGSRDLKYSPDIALPATVLQLGWGEE